MPQRQENFYDDEVYIDVNLIPKHTQENLARATLEFYKRFIAQPGAREMLEKKKAELGLI